MGVQPGELFEDGLALFARDPGAGVAHAERNPGAGARPLKRAIQQQLENPLSKSILEGKFGPKDTIRVDAKGGVFSFDKAKSKVKEKAVA